MVRNLLITISCVMAAIAAMAQDTRPFEPLFVDGKSWEYQCYSYPRPQLNEFYTFTVSGDTIVDGRECKRLVRHSEDGKRSDYCFAVYEEGGKSFVHDGYGAFMPIFDFTVKPGDVVDQRDNWTVFESWAVNAIEERELRGYKRRVITLSDCMFFGANYWIEGIGSLTRFNTIVPFEWPTNGSWEYFVECRQDGELILIPEDMGFSVVESILDNKEQDDGVVYDIHGRRVENPQGGHIYIRNGQKFVQK